MSIEDGLTYRHRAYALAMKAYRQANADWKEREKQSEQYAKKWMESSARAYEIAQVKLSQHQQ